MTRRVAVLFAVLLAVPPILADLELYRMQIGDPARRDKRVPLVLDAVTDARDGSVIDPARLPERLAGVRLLLVGEMHTSPDHHRVQLEVIRSLVEAGRRVTIGLEMFPYTQQQALDRFVAGQLDEAGFLEAAGWWEHWGYAWDYYREIFLYARDRRIPLRGLNVPREVVRAVRESGLDKLPEEDRRHVPAEVDTSSDDHWKLFRATFSDDKGFHGTLPDEQWRGMFEAQCTWDASMAHNAVRAVSESDDPKSIVVVLVGAGHIAYGLGIERQAARWLDAPIASIVPFNVDTLCDGRLEQVQASYATFLWGLPPEAAPPLPSLGVTAIDDRASGRRRVIDVSDHGPAGRAGVETNDLLLALDGRDLDSRATFNRAMAGLRWGQSVRLTLERGEEQKTVVVELRRTWPPHCDDEEQE